LFVATEIDLCIAGGRHRRAEMLIAEEIRLAKADGRTARLVELALARAVIASQAHQPAAANRHLTQAVTLAAPRGIVRPFRDHAKAIASLVEDTKPSAWGFALEKERKFFAEMCRMLPISNRLFQDRLVALNMESQLLETLTARQMELLGLLAAGLSNQQLADRINVTVTTIKGHLQKLYGKLGVSSRAAALARARVLNLIP
jgi:LuxR family maltose regulon positive regulatory protein